MDIEPLWALYRDLTRQAYEAEKKYKSEEAAEKPCSTLTYIELNDLRARAAGVMRSIEALSEDRQAAWKRGFEIWKEENGLAPEGEFGCWMPVKKKPYPDATEVRCLVTAVNKLGRKEIFVAFRSRKTSADPWRSTDLVCSNKYGRINDGWTITAWMLLPDPYTGDSAESDTHEED